MGSWRAYLVEQGIVMKIIGMKRCLNKKEGKESMFSLIMTYYTEFLEMSIP